MSNKTETITLHVTEVVESTVTIEVTDELLRAAELAEYPRSAAGVARWLADDADERAEVADGAADPKNFAGVVEREVTDWEVN